MTSWPIARLADLCAISIGRTPRRDTQAYWGGKAVWVTISELNGQVINDSKEHISDLAVTEVMGDPIAPGTLLLSFKLSIGKMAVAGVPLFTNEAIAALPVKHGVSLLREFLRYALIGVTRAAHANDAVLGRVLNKKKLEELPIPLPPIQEQKRIVEILSEAEALCLLRGRASERMEAVGSALFNLLFGAPPPDWPRDTLGNLGSLDRGKSRHRPRDEAFLYGGPYPFIQTGDVANCSWEINTFTQTYSELGIAQSRLWPAGTLCITVAANIAKTGVLGFDACFPDSVVGFIPGKRVRVEFIQYWLRTLQGRLEEDAPQAAQKNINLQTLRELQLAVPPLAQQNEFAARIAELRGILTSQTVLHHRLSDLFQSLLQRAFRGEL